MNNPSLNDYVKSPCSASSLPYWKQKSFAVPNNIKIVHANDFSRELLTDYTDEPYFKLFHGLKTVNKIDNENVEIIAAAGMTEIFVDTINASYDDLTVTQAKIESFKNTPVYRSDLWVIAKDKRTGKYAGSAIADYDGEIGELIIEWVQILPTFRGRGYAQAMVNYLLERMRGTAKFATVSGKANNPSNPEKLYRNCGFTGDDIWHILYKKQT